MSARLRLVSSLLGVSVLFVIGCDRSSGPSRDVAAMEKQVAALEKRVRQLEADLEAMAAARGGGGPTTSGAMPLEAGGAGPAGGASTGADAAGELAPAGDAGENDAGSQPLAPPTAGIEVVANPELKGAMGRLIVEFPADAKVDDTSVKLHKAGEKKAGATEYGNLTAELLPGQYELVISGARVGGAEVKARHDTRIPVGVLRIATSAKDTTVAVLSAEGKQLNTGYGSREVGLPAGKYLVRVAGQTAPVEIKAGEVTEF